jgi:hypothetical protein
MGFLDTLRSWIGSFRPALTIDAGGWLVGPAVIRMPSRRGGTSVLLSTQRPLGVVRHGTATAWGTGAAIARSWRDTFDEHSAHVTCDVIVEPARSAEVKRWRALGWAKEADQLAALPIGAGVIYQHRSFLQGAWHAGSASSGTIEGHGPNDATIGIEATCVGQVARKLDDQWRGWRAESGVGYGPAVPADHVETIGGKTYHRYHPAALEIERLMDAALLARFPSLAGTVGIKPSAVTKQRKRDGINAEPVLRMAIGHDHFDPTRKTDPYPTGALRGRGA